MMSDPFGHFDFRGKKTAIVSLGCARNTVDSQVFLQEARKRGAVISSAQDARVVLINTCSFTREAKEESLSVIAEWLEHKKKGRVESVLVLGCLARRYPKEIRQGYDDIDVVGGLVQETGIRDPGGAPVLLTPRSYAYLKISEGCNNRCTYCAIPLIKGRSRSRPEAEVVAEAVRLERCGIRELNIVGQDITLYGCEGRRLQSGRLPLVGLVEKILRATSIPWIRLMYLHPQRVSEDVIDLLARHRRLCPYVDLPLQHINDRVLRQMGRRTARKDIVRLISELRKKVASIALRTTFIVGFPGETKKEFRELLDFVRETRFDKLGAFMFSREEGTRAYAYHGQVPQKEKQKRYHELMETQKGISLSLLEKKIGMTTPVLVEEVTQDRRIYLARTPWDAPEVDGLVYLTSSKKLKPGQIVACRITDAFEYDLAGEAL
jgi:ribosomal protein S12 methylthiotransferase